MLEPPGPSEVLIHVDVGEGSEISPELRAALDRLVEALHASEVEGFVVPCPDLAGCSSYRCTLGACQPQTKYPCAYDERCRIGQFKLF